MATKKRTPSAFDEVDQHVRSLPYHQTAAGALVMPDLCSAYQAFRPILLLITSWMPSRWQAVAKSFTDAMDAQCPQ